MSSDIIAATGLILDIIGAALIAIPDARALFSHTSTGALQEARDRMILVGVQEDDTGFDILSDILSNIEPIAEFGAERGGDQYEEIKLNSLGGAFQASETKQHDEFQWGEEYIEARYQVDGDWEETDFFEVSKVLDSISARGRPRIAQFRLYGLLTLFCGFSLQLLATINASPRWAVTIIAITFVLGFGVYVNRDNLD